MSTSEHWRRDKPSHYNFLALDRSPIKQLDAVGGLNGALMSHDLHSGAMTFVVEVPHGWRTKQDAEDGTLEIFMLRGDIALDGTSVGSGGIVNLPQSCGGGELTAEGDGLALVFWNPNLPAFSSPYTVSSIRRVWDIPWEDSLGEGVHGELHKSLRTPDFTGGGFDGGPGGFLRIAHLEPHLQAPLEHVHDECWEEIIFLSGDTLLANEGICAPGSVVSHPQNWWHAPFATRTGAIILNHTDAPMGFPWRPREYPNAEALCDAYFDLDSIGEPAVHTSWEDVDPRLRAIVDTPENRAFEAGPEGAEYADLEPNEGSSRYRASWSRSS